MCFPDGPFATNSLLDGLRITVGTDVEIDRLLDALRTLARSVGNFPPGGPVTDAKHESEKRRNQQKKCQNRNTQANRTESITPSAVQSVTPLKNPFATTHSPMNAINETTAAVSDSFILVGLS